MTTTPFDRRCNGCAFKDEPAEHPSCSTCAMKDDGSFSGWVAPVGHNGCPDLPAETVQAPPVSLPEDPETRRSYPMVSGLLDYFPNALAEVAKLSFLATQQHHPDKPMHWDRSKSTDHPDNIMRHLVDRHTVDDKGIDHWCMLVWRGLAGYQLYLEEKHGYPPSRASRNVPTN